jgi:hypothetical protein
MATVVYKAIIVKYPMPQVLQLNHRREHLGVDGDAQLEGA